MTSHSKFSVQAHGQLIVVNLNGNWTEQDDLLYISMLSEIIFEVRGSSWGLLVDMRGWNAQEASTKATSNIALDRRNQKMECWIVDDIQQGEFLQVFFKNTHVKPVKCFTTQDAKTILQKAGFDAEQIS